MLIVVQVGSEVVFIGGVLLMIFIVDVIDVGVGVCLKSLLMKVL
jgi:hypothetical protein